MALRNLQAGKLDRFITIQQATSSRDATYGSETKAWATLAQVWARVEDVSGREFFAAKQRGGDTMVKVIIRHRSDVTRLMRLVLDDGRTLEIDTVLQISRDKGLELVAKEINA